LWRDSKCGSGCVVSLESADVDDFVDVGAEFAAFAVDDGAAVALNLLKNTIEQILKYNNMKKTEISNFSEQKQVRLRDHS